MILFRDLRVSIILIVIFYNSVNGTVCPERILKCDYYEMDNDGWFKYSFCKVDRYPLKQERWIGNIAFTGTEDEKLGALGVSFSRAGNVELIPKQILTEFVNLNALYIDQSKLPIIKESLFPTEFEKLQVLDLPTNNISQIEPSAFWNLINLETINLYDNQIKSLGRNLFVRNLKLKLLYLSDNQITMIHPEIFVDKTYLTFVNMESNECFSGKFGRNEPDIDNLENELTPCFENCEKNVECSMEKPIFVVNRTGCIVKNENLVPSTPLLK